MDALQKELDSLEKKGNLQKSIEDVQKAIDLLVNAKDAIAADPRSAAMSLAKLQTPLKQSFDKVNEDLKTVHGGLNRYSKALEKKFKDKPLPNAETDALSSHPALVNRAIAMHLLREGQFAVASTFIEEANKNPPRPALPSDATSAGHNATTSPQVRQVQRAWEEDFAAGTARSEVLQRQFAEMYHILHELRQARNLVPAINWARVHSVELEHRGSNLEFELCRLQFVRLFMSDGDDEGRKEAQAKASSAGRSSKNGTVSGKGPLNAWSYARREFASFQHRYSREIQQLLGAMAFWQNLADSPYRRTFHNDSAWEEVATSFTREFCSLLGLSADSPLYVATTAGAIALPRMLKMQSIMKEKRTEWTTQHELPIEIPLPSSYHFHSIFVCPVSKEQGTDQNPPMMMPCGHVIAKESLEKLSKGAKFKCPYCPSESHPRDAKKVFL